MLSFLFLRGDWSGLFFFIIKIITTFSQNIFVKNKKKLICPICGIKEYHFLHLSNSIRITFNSACPSCNSRSRHRGLFFLYEEILLKQKKKRILHFAPEKFLSKIIMKHSSHKYETTDLHMKNVDFTKEDIQKLKFKDNTYDIILNNHVLEHVSDDQKALKEIIRILKPNGVGIITIPVDWNKNKTIIFDNLDNNGHFRHYGIDILNRLNKIFSKVFVKKLYSYQGKKYAIKKDEVAFICIK